MDEQYKDWLNGLKVGDHVIVCSQDIGCSYGESEIIKVTPAGSHRVNGMPDMLFKNGRVHLDKYGPTFKLLEPTPELVDTIDLSRMRRYLKKIAWEDVDDDIVKQVREVLR